MTFTDSVGLVGVALIVGTYFLSQAGRMATDRPLYPALNGVGAILILVSLHATPNLASIVIEAFWLAISVFGLVRALKAQR